MLVCYKVTYVGKRNKQYSCAYKLLPFTIDDVTDQEKVVTKSEGTCVVIGPDQHPRGIPNCPFKVGDTLIITYKQGTAPVEKYQLKR
jgi:hypothetical protein